MLVLGRGVVRDLSTAYAHDACCKTFFPREDLALHARDTVCTAVLSKARVISIEVRYHVHLKQLVICLLVTARAYIVRRMALLFLSRCS